MTAGFEMTTQDLLENAIHVGVGGVYLVDDKKLSKKGGGAHVSVGDLER
jgi:hypothetical protein